MTAPYPLAGPPVSLDPLGVEARIVAIEDRMAALWLARDLLDDELRRLGQERSALGDIRRLGHAADLAANRAARERRAS